ncbi:hypothetical protein P7C73_g96, partial [Tremellales sp. Uapishka_1]
MSTAESTSLPLPLPLPPPPPLPLPSDFPVNLFATAPLGSVEVICDLDFALFHGGKGVPEDILGHTMVGVARKIDGRIGFATGFWQLAALDAASHRRPRPGQIGPGEEPLFKGKTSLFTTMNELMLPDSSTAHFTGRYGVDVVVGPWEKQQSLKEQGVADLSSAVCLDAINVPTFAFKTKADAVAGDHYVILAKRYTDVARARARGHTINVVLAIRDELLFAAVQDALNSIRYSRLRCSPSSR